MGKIKTYTPEEIQRKFLEYKTECDNRTREILTIDKSGTTVVRTISAPVSAKILGFCKYLGLSRQSYYDYYVPDPLYADIVTRIREACELDLVEKFENNTLTPQLAGLLLSKYGYSTKTESDVTAAPFEVNVNVVDGGSK